MTTLARKLMFSRRQQALPGLLFVRGHPRSGTNWVGMLLNLHPRVHCTGEFHLEPIYRAAEQAKSYPWQLTSADPVRSQLDTAIQGLFRGCISAACLAECPREDIAWYGDRTPRPLIDLVPGERYIWVLRDGRDVLVSWTFHQIRLGPEVINKSIPSGPREHLLEASEQFRADPDVFRKHPDRLLKSDAWVANVASDWDHFYRANLDEAKRMESNATPSKLFRLRYESLRADTEMLRQQLYEFLDLDPSLAKPLSLEAGTSPGFDHENPKSFRRKGEVGDWKNYFTDETEVCFKAAAGQSLIDAGYEKDSNW